MVHKNMLGQMIKTALPISSILASVSSCKTQGKGHWWINLSSLASQRTMLLKLLWNFNIFCFIFQSDERKKKRLMHRPLQIQFQPMFIPQSSSPTFHGYSSFSTPLTLGTLHQRSSAAVRKESGMNATSTVLSFNNLPQCIKPQDFMLLIKIFMYPSEHN